MKNAKKIGLLASGFAAQRFGQSLETEQEILVNIADIFQIVYRNGICCIDVQKKQLHRVGAEKSNQKLLYTQIFCQEAFDEIEKDAKETLIAVEQGDTFRMMLSALRKFTRHTPINVIAKKREVADKLISTERFTV